MIKLGLALLLLAITAAWDTSMAAGGYGIIIADPAPKTGWQNVCRDRVITRRVSATQVQTYQIPLCTMVWVGKRYFRDGHYFADPNFVSRIY